MQKQAGVLNEKKKLFFDKFWKAVRVKPKFVPICNKTFVPHWPPRNSAVLRMSKEGNIIMKRFEYDLLEFSQRHIRLNKKAFEPAKVAHILKQIILCLADCSVKGIIHGDLKPENIGITEYSDGFIEVGVFDFDYASIGDKICRSFYGTHYYSSPEKNAFLIESEFGDVWSIGIIASLLGRTKPNKRFIKDEQTDSHADCMNLLSGSFDYSSIPSYMRDFIDTCCRTNPMKRPTFVTLLQHSMLKLCTCSACI